MNLHRLNISESVSVTLLEEAQRVVLHNVSLDLLSSLDHLVISVWVCRVHGLVSQECRDRLPKPAWLLPSTF